MSAPDTNIERQEENHRPSLLGIKGAMAFGALMIILLIGYNVLNAGDPDAVTNESGAAVETTTAID